MLPVPYAAQIDDGACLPACAQMVLAYLGRSVKQTQLKSPIRPETRIQSSFPMMSF